MMRTFVVATHPAAPQFSCRWTVAKAEGLTVLGIAKISLWEDQDLIRLNGLGALAFAQLTTAKRMPDISGSAACK